MVDALGASGDEGRGVPAISCGEVATNLWSADLRMGKPCDGETSQAPFRRDVKTQMSNLKTIG